MQKDITHGMYGTPEYTAWANMLYRCNTPTARNYALYGGRGITVCPEWHQFEAFYADMGLRPSMRHSLDRIDNAKGYSPENCRWATAREQTNNRRCTRRVSFNGIVRPLSEWADELGVPYDFLIDRIGKYGWSIERAFTTPCQTKGALYSAFGETHTIAEWARLRGVKYCTLRKRIVTLGMSMEKALSS